MMGATSGVEKSVKSNAAITAFTLAKFGADDDTMGPAAAVSDAIVGVFQHAADSGAEVRVMLSGISRVVIGGNVTRGDLITSNGSGQGVAAAPAAGTNNRIVGVALASGVSGDIIPVLVNPSRPQG